MPKNAVNMQFGDHSLEVFRFSLRRCGAFRRRARSRRLCERSSDFRRYRRHRGLVQLDRDHGYHRAYDHEHPDPDDGRRRILENARGNQETRRRSLTARCLSISP